jgi:AraC family transcriptional regulator
VFSEGLSETRHSKRYAKKNGTIFAYRAGEVHRWLSPNSLSKSVNIELGRAFLGTYSISEDELIQSLETNPAAKLLILRILKEAEYTNQSNEIIKTILLELTSRPIKNVETLPLWVKEIHDYVFDNWNHSFSLFDVSNAAGVHPVTVSKYFKHYMRYSPHELQKKLRIQKSISLLKQSSSSHADIAMQCGFSDQSHFIRHFKQETHFLPKEFTRF